MGQREEVAIIGGGLAGLSAAWYLHKAGVPTIVLEGSDRFGGRVKTVKLGGCTFDVGAVGMLGTYNDMVELVHDIGLADELHRNPVKLAIPRDGQMQVLDMGRPLSIPGTKLLSGASKLKLLKLSTPMLKLWKRINFETMSGLSDMDKETLGSFSKRELNPELYEYLVSPIIRALWQRDPEHTPLIDLFCSLKVFAPTMYNLDGGLQRVTDRLASHLAGLTQAHVHKVSDGDHGVTVDYEHEGTHHSDVFSQAVLAMPPESTASVLHTDLQDILAGLAEQPYSCSVNVHLVLSRRVGNDVLIAFPPESEAPDLTTVVFEHNKGPGRAPPNKGAVSLFWHDRWSRKYMHSSDDTVVHAAIDEARRIIPELDVSIVEAAHVERWPYSCVCRAVGGTRGLEKIERAADKLHSIVLAGDYFVLSGMNAAIVSGRRAAERILALRNTPTTNAW